MSLDTYEGQRRDAIASELGDAWNVTESSHRPAAMRFEASRHDGTPSLFASTLAGLHEAIREHEAEIEPDARLDELEAALEVVATIMAKLGEGPGDLMEPLETIQDRVHDSINELDEWRNPGDYAKT